MNDNDNMECENTGYADIRRHQGARQVRIDQMIKSHPGHDWIRADAYALDHGKSDGAANNEDGK